MNSQKLLIAAFAIGLGSLTFAVRGQEMLPEERFLRCVDYYAVSKWLHQPLGMQWDSYDHDGLSWSEREEKYKFRIIGLKPSDFPDVRMNEFHLPKGLEEHSPIPELSSDLESQLVSFTTTAEEYHLTFGSMAKIVSSQEIMGPLACRSVGALMRNVGGYSHFEPPDGPRYVAKDRSPNPMQAYIYLEYLDPKAAAEYIQELESKKQ